MADLIKVSPDAMRTKAGELRKCSTNIQDIIGQVKTEINAMKTTWEGAAAEKYVRQFEQLSDNFQERYDVIESYAKFLEGAATEFDSAETANVNEEDNLIV
jgi:WXG100 family type VII secretion target